MPDAVLASGAPWLAAIRVTEEGGFGMETTTSAIFFMSAAERESPTDDELPDPSMRVQDGGSTSQ